MAKRQSKRTHRLLVQQFHVGDEGSICIIAVVDRLITQARVLDMTRSGTLPLRYTWINTVMYRGERFRVRHQAQTVDGELIPWTLLLHENAFKEHVR